jgi:hypothetical protein
MLVWAHGQAGLTGRLVPLTVDGLIYTSSLVMLDSARWKVPVPALARLLLGLGITATLAANVMHGLGHGLTGAMVTAWLVVALVRAYELLMVVIRGAQARPQSRVDRESSRRRQLQSSSRTAVTSALVSVRRALLCAGRQS